MNIDSAMRKNDIRLVNGKRWMVWDNEEWVVYSRQHGEKKNRVMVRTQIQDEAIEVLLQD